MTPSGHQLWCDILADLRGRRLAIYDDMLRTGGHRIDWECRAENDRDAVEWLAQFHFVWWDADDGFWRTRDARRARELYEKQGPSVVLKPQAEREPSVMPVLPAIAVQTCQLEVFALDGYRA